MRTWAKGLLCLEVAIELLIGDGAWLYRGDFLETAVELAQEPGRVMACVDFTAAVEALGAGALAARTARNPCCGSRRASRPRHPLEGRELRVLGGMRLHGLLVYQFCQVIEHGRGSGLMTQVPDSFRPAGRLRIRQEANEDEIGKALPDPVIRRLDASLHLLDPAGRAGSIPAASLQAMRQVLRDTGRRPGEVVSLRTGCIEVTGGQHSLIYDNHKAGRMRRRLPITTGTAQAIMDWEQRRASLPTTPAQRHWLFPSPLRRAQRSHGHLNPEAVARAFNEWVARIGPIDGELRRRDGRPVPFDPSLITPYALRHCYAQRYADAGVPVNVLKPLMDHVSVTTTMGHYRVSLKRKLQGIRSVGPLTTDAVGNPAPFAYQRASVVPFGNCTEPSNVKAGGGTCPIRFQCAGCGFYRPDLSYLPALEQHIASLCADRETALAIGAADYVLANLTAESTRSPRSPTPPGCGEPVSQASLRTDLAVARDEIRRLRAERDKLRARLRIQLGAEIEGPGRAELIARVASLEVASRQLAVERDAPRRALRNLREHGGPGGPPHPQARGPQPARPTR